MVFGTIGLNGSGKDEVVKHLKKRYGMPLVFVGDMVRQIAAQKNMPLTRINLNNISREYIQNFGKDYFMKQVISQIGHRRWERVGVSGIRTPEDVQTLREYYDDYFILFHVYVDDPYIRYERIRRRGEPRDPKTFQAFLEQDMAEEELFRIREAAKLADFSLNNDASLENLQQKLDRLFITKGFL